MVTVRSKFNFSLENRTKASKQLESCTKTAVSRSAQASDEGALLDEERYANICTEKETETHGKYPRNQSFQLFVHYDSKAVPCGSAILQVVRMFMFIKFLSTVPLFPGTATT